MVRNNHNISLLAINNYITKQIVILRGKPMEKNILEIRPAGYAYLMEKLELTGFSNWHTSFVSLTGTHRSKILGEA